MTASKTNQWKLGLFVTTGLGVALGTLLWLGANTFRQDVRKRYCLFDESVTGLDIGSPARYRGVIVGTVADIGFLGDGRTVLVTLDVYGDKLAAMGLESGSGTPSPGMAEARKSLAVQLASAGITGGKYILADLFPPESYDRIEVDTPLPAFVDPGENLIPSIPSSLKNLEEVLVAFTDSFPELLSDVKTAVQEIARLSTTLEGLVNAEVKTLLQELIEKAEGVQAAEISQGVVNTLDALKATLHDVETISNGFVNEDRPRLTALIDDLSSLSTTLEQAVADARAGETAASLRATLDRAGGTADTASDLLGDLQMDGDMLTEELRLTAQELRRTLQSVDFLAELIERDPGILLRGRTANDSTGGNP